MKGKLLKILVGLPVSVGIIFCFIPVQAATRTVCLEAACGYKTIQSGINASSNGDTVIVSGGTYNENVDYKGKAITVQSKYGAANTIIDRKGKENRRAVYFKTNEGGNSILDGFTISDSDTGLLGGGIRCENSAPTIKNCILKNNKNEYGGALRCDNASPYLYKCTMQNNSASYDGGGIYLLNSAPMLEECVITSNRADDDGGGIACDNSSPYLYKSTISYNTAKDAGGAAIGDGGGIYAKSKSSPKIVDSYIQNNEAKDDGGGIYSDSSSSPTLENSSIQNNKSGDNGAGIYCLTASPTLRDCTISGNIASGNGRGGGIFCRDNSSPTISGGSMQSDTDSAGSNEIYLLDTTSSITVENCSVQGGWPI